MKIEIDKEFLRSQRMPGRPGLLGVDMKLMKKEKRQTIRKNTEARKRQKYEAELSNILGNYYNFNTEKHSTIYCSYLFIDHIINYFTIIL